MEISAKIIFCLGVLVLASCDDDDHTAQLLGGGPGSSDPNNIAAGDGFCGPQGGSQALGPASFDSGVTTAKIDTDGNPLMQGHDATWNANTSGQVNGQAVNSARKSTSLDVRCKLLSPRINASKTRSRTRPHSSLYSRVLNHRLHKTIQTRRSYLSSRTSMGRAGMQIDPVRLLLVKFAKAAPLTYSALKSFIEKERPDWIRALIPRNIEVPAQYWPQKVLAVATLQGVIRNQIAQDLGERLDLTFGTIKGQMGQLLHFAVPTFYVSKELLEAATRTDLPGELLLDAIPFPFPALVFMLPKGTIRHPTEGECPYIVVSRTDNGHVSSLPLEGITVSIPAADAAIIASTYLPEANYAYYKSISLIPGETIKAAFERASTIPLEFPGGESAEWDEGFLERLWLLGLTLVLIMASGEKLIETGRQLKIVRPKNHSDAPIEYWSPNYFGRVYQAKTEGGDLESHL